MKTDLNKKIEEAKTAENSESFFSAAIIYKEALEMAKKLEDSVSIKLCKAKVVEMNKKSIESGKDFQEHEFVHDLTEEQSNSLKNFIVGILKIDDKNRVLKIIGQHPDFMPKVKDVDILAKRTMPITYQFATLTTISDEGHNLRGGSLAEYSWFMQMYDLSLKQIVTLCLNRLMYMLINGNPYGKMMNIEEISDYFSKSELFTPNQLKIVLVGIKKYYEEDYISALHILVPQFESFLLSIAKQLGISTVALDTTVDTATRTKVLSERDFDSEDFIKIFGEDFCRQIKFVLFEPMGYKLRHKVAHGEIAPAECNFQNTTLVLYLYFVILGRVGIKKSKD